MPSYGWSLGGAPAGGAPGAEPSPLQRERVCGRRSAACVAHDQPRFTGSSVGTSSLICQRTRASDRLSARLLCGTLAGRQATHRMVIDAPSSSSDQQRVKVVERSHRRQSSAAQKAAGAVRRVAARPRLASSVGCGTKRAGFGGRSLPPYLTLPYRTLPYPRRLPVLLQMAVVVGKEFFFFAFEVYYINSLCVSCLLDNQQFI